MRQPRRVAWLGQRSATAGDGLVTYSRQTVRGLRERGIEVRFFHHDRAGADDASVALKAIPVGSRFRLSPPAARRHLEAELAAARVDLVHVSLSFSSLDFQLPAICSRLRIPLVATLHAPFDTRMTIWGGLSRVLYRIYSATLGAYDRVIVFGPSQRDLLLRMGIPEARVAVIPNGVDVERWTPGRSRFRTGFPEPLLITYLGRIDPEKNVGRLLDGFRAVAPDAVVRLVLVGEGRDRRRLMAASAGDPRVTWTGLVGEAEARADILRGCDVFVLPSAIEGLSLSLLEAMACAACPVATDVGCDADAVRGAGIALDVGSLDSDLRLALRLLFDFPDLARRLGRRARERAVERYSLSGNLDRLIDLYAEVTGGRRRATA